MEKELLEKTTDIAEEVATKTQHILGGRKAEHFLGWWSFAESSVVPVLIDPLLIAMVLAHRERWARFAFIASAGSVLGGIFAYILGAFFFEYFGAYIISTFGLEDAFWGVQKYIDKGAFIFTMIGALTPVPYKLVALSGGVFKIDFIAFIVASILGRSFRFFVISYTLHKFGEHFRKFLTWRFMLFVTAILVAVVYIFR